MQKPDYNTTRKLFGFMCLDLPVFRRCKELFYEKGLLDEVYPMQEFLLSTVVECVRDNEGVLPDLEVIKVSLLAGIDEVGGVDPEYVAELEKLHQAAVALSKQPELFDRYRRAANKSIDALYSFCMRRQATDSIASPRPLLDSLQQIQRDLTVGLATEDQKFENVFDKQRKIMPAGGRFISIGIPFVDLYTGGNGPASGDVVGHGAPRGGGKSTLASQVAVSTAKREKEIAVRTKKPARITYLFNYESIKDPMVHVLSNYGKIPRHTVLKYITEWNEGVFSEGKDYKDYEKRRYANQIAKAVEGKQDYPPAEKERMIRAKEFVTEYINLVDFTGMDPDFEGMSKRYVDGIVDYIEQHQERVKRPGVAGVIIDYAGSCVRTYISATKGISETSEPSLITDLPLLSKRGIANKYGCFVWIAQQMAAAEANRRPGTRPDPNAFKNCKAFPENCDYTIVSGMPGEDGITVFVQSKARNDKPRRDEVIQLNAEYCQWVEPEESYEVHGGTAMTAQMAREMMPDDDSDELVAATRF